jgi:hypothetical protein
VPGASEKARRVKILNANWIVGDDGDDGDFELMIVTSDDRQHDVAPSPAAMTALVALAQADAVLVWDPVDRRLIAANLRGTMPWTQDPATPGTWRQLARDRTFACRRWRYRWGIHINAEGMVALIAVESPDYMRLVKDPRTAKVKAFRSTRA